ncbi:MAG: hypothetical protein ACE5FU_11455 [Nitrospinota bacterium]
MRFSLLFSLFLFSSCASVDPNKVTIELEKTAPKAKITSYTQSLRDLGLMTEIYASDVLRIQSNPINDKTGTSGTTGGEVPRDITEMLKSALNSIGGNVVYIPYDPAFVQNQMVTGYSEFSEKVIPDVILSGGITEFDRGLETKGQNTDVALGAELRGLSEQFPSKDLGVRYGQTEKRGLARITLDFNLLNFRTMTGIPRMNVVNTMEVKKGLKGKELGISIFGQSFGRKGDVKKVQGRHDAVRLLVELSMIQVVGKYGALPYWRLLGEGVTPDKDVQKAISRFYYTLSQPEIITSVQEWLFLHGYDLGLTGELDEKTVFALQEVDRSFLPESNEVNLATFQSVYFTIPITEETLGRRNKLNQIFENQELGQTGDDGAFGDESAEVLKMEPVSEETPSKEAFHSQVVSADSQKGSNDLAISGSKEDNKEVVRKKNSVGRLLTDEEW